MDVLRRIYPPLNERRPLPALYIPTIYVVYAITVFIPGKYARIFVTFPLLLVLALGVPCYTTGDISQDYGSGGAPFSLLLAYIDFYIFSQLEDEPRRWTGQLNPKNAVTDIREDDCTTMWQKIEWTLRFTTIVRGIGWNVQVKGVPVHHAANSSRFEFVRQIAFFSARCWVYKLLCVAGIGFATSIHAESESPVLRPCTSILIGWLGGAWAMNGINWLYSTAAALTVALGIYQPWEWPPLFGPLSEAWSVRQMWSVVWHQLVRRLAQTPGVRLARFLGLKKGSIASRYTQLYIAFAISLIIHLVQIFNANRHEVGESFYFLSQPFVITVEDFVQWCWRERRRPSSSSQLDSASKAVGYIWTFAWFSYCLPSFVKGLLSVGIIGNAYVEPLAISLGGQAAISWMRSS